LIRHTSLSAFQGKNVLVNPRFRHTHFIGINFDRHPVVNPVHHCALFIRQHWRGFPDYYKLSPPIWIVVAGQIMAIAKATHRNADWLALVPAAGKSTKNFSDLGLPDRNQQDHSNEDR
jgi:hypothetical protein